MSRIQDFGPALVHWSFGSAVLVGLVASEFTGAETVAAVLVAACASALSALCACRTVDKDEPSRRRPASNLLAFLAIWLGALTDLVAASTCARLASATVDYISKGHFREFLFGLEQHSLGEPWPDVLGVAIVLVVTALFMLGLERSPAISALLWLALLGHFAFFVVVGGFHAVHRLDEWFAAFQIRTPRTVLKAAAICSFGFVRERPVDRPRLVVFAVLVPLLAYAAVAVVFALMTRHGELLGTAIPLIQVFENRDVDWARPVMAVLTVGVACLLLTEIAPQVHSALVRLGGREWRVLVSSIQFRSGTTGAPVLAIFAAGSLAAILAFACPLSHLIKLLNAACSINCALASGRAILSRYRPEAVRGDAPGGAGTGAHYSKLGANGSVGRRRDVAWKERIRGAFFANKPVYVHRLASPKSLRPPRKDDEERRRLIEDGAALAADVADESHSDNEETEMDVLSDDSGSSTDIDVIVEEYKEGLKVAAMGTFGEGRPATGLTFATAVAGLVGVVGASVGLALHVVRIAPVCWPYSLGVGAAVLLVTAMPPNAAERAKPCPVPASVFAAVHAASITVHVVLASAVASDVWQGLAFWTLAGLLLYWKCECCACECAPRRGASDDEGKRRLPDHIHVAR